MLSNMRRNIEASSPVARVTLFAIIRSMYTIFLVDCLWAVDPPQPVPSVFLGRASYDCPIIFFRMPDNHY
jgi:hypothetical protein